MTETGATGGNAQLIQDCSQREFREASEETLSPKSLQRVFRALICPFERVLRGEGKSRDFFRGEESFVASHLRIV